MERLMKQLSFKAILIGCLADWIGTFAFTFALDTCTVILSALRGMSLTEIEAALMEWHKSVPGIVCSSFYGFGFTLLGGYIAAKLSKTGHLLNSALVGGLGILLGFFFIAETPKVLFFLSVALPIPLSLLGGFWYKRQSKSY